MHLLKLVLEGGAWLFVSCGAFYIGSLLPPPGTRSDRETMLHRIFCLAVPPIMLGYYVLQLIGMAAAVRNAEIQQAAVEEARERQLITKYLAAANKEVAEICGEKVSKAKPVFPSNIELGKYIEVTPESLVKSYKKLRGF